MNKEQLVRETARRTGLSEAQSSRVCAAIVDLVIETLLRRERLVIANFGVLKPLLRSKRTAVNPLSKAVYIIPPRWDVKFLPSQYLKNAVNEPVLPDASDAAPVEIIVPVPERRRRKAG